MASILPNKLFFSIIHTPDIQSMMAS